MGGEWRGCLPQAAVGLGRQSWATPRFTQVRGWCWSGLPTCFFFQERLRSSMLERWPLSWPLPACSTAQSSQRKVSAGSVWVQGQDELLEGMSTPPHPPYSPHPIWGWEWLWQSPPIPSWPHKTLHNDWSSPSSQRVKRASVISAQVPPGPPGARTRRE